MNESFRELVRNITIPGIATGLIAATFSTSIGLEIIISVAQEGKLSDDLTVSWILASFACAGFATMLVTLYTKQPIVIAWNIPGAIVVGKYLAAGGNVYDAAGTYIAISIVVLLLTVTGWIKKIIEYIPVPIMLGMVGGILLNYGIGAFENSITSPIVYGPMVVSFFLWLSLKQLSSKFPAIIVAAIVGAIFLKYNDLIKDTPVSWGMATPVFVTPTFDVFSLITLGVPLLFMVVGVQNIHAVGVLISKEYNPPINTIYTVPSIVTFVNALMGAHTGVTAGPGTAIVASNAAGRKEYRYIAAFVDGFFWVMVGLMGKIGVELTRLVPAQYIQTLVGLALFDVFISTFQGAFRHNFRNGAMASFFVASTNVTLFSLGTPFWAIIIGFCVSLLTEKEDFVFCCKKQA